MRRFFSEHLPNALKQPFDLPSTTSHHVLRVVGIAPNESFVVFDGHRAMVVVIQSVEKGVATCIGIEWSEDKSSNSEIWLLLGLLRSGPMSVALRMATELGVSHIIPVSCDRSVARGEKAQRWLSILQSAAAQCGRVQLPTLHPLMNQTRAIEVCESIEKRFVLSPQASVGLQRTQQVAVWIGPEGGLSPNELSLGQEAGWQSASLGQYVLRADTAVAASLAQLN